MIREFHFTTKELAEILGAHVQHQLGIRHGATFHCKASFRLTVSTSSPDRLVGGSVDRVTLVVAESTTELEERYPGGLATP